MPFMSYRDQLLNLLAVIHQDGGQYTERYGIKQSVEDANALIAEQNAHSPSPIDRERIMFQWDAWRELIAHGYKGSAPRDWFESILDTLEERRKFSHTGFCGGDYNLDICDDCLTERECLRLYVEEHSK